MDYIFDRDSIGLQNVSLDDSQMEYLLNAS